MFYALHLRSDSRASGMKCEREIAARQRSEILKSAHLLLRVWPRRRELGRQHCRLPVLLLPLLRYWMMITKMAVERLSAVGGWCPAWVSVSWPCGGHPWLASSLDHIAAFFTAVFRQRRHRQLLVCSIKHCTIQFVPLRWGNDNRY